MCCPPFITVLVDNNRAGRRGMEVFEREDRAEINYCLYLTVAGSVIISPLLSPLLSLPLCVPTFYSVSCDPRESLH